MIIKLMNGINKVMISQQTKHVAVDLETHWNIGSKRACCPLRVMLNRVRSWSTCIQWILTITMLLQCSILNLTYT